jgi:hypothetical protein
MTPDRRHARKGSLHPRFPDSREIRQRFLIVCEGKKTEPLYFGGFKVPKDVRTIDVVGTGRNTVYLVNEAIKLKEQGDYDQVWCVFDVEEHSQEEINAACKLARKNNIQVAISNQAFELWYLLHFHYHRTPIDRQQYIEKLSKELGFKYKKNVCIYDRLIDCQATALKNARKLLQQYTPYDPARNDPSTTVHLLVEELNRFSPEARARQ